MSLCVIKHYKFFFFFSVWNWRKHYCTHTFSNGNPSGSKITSLKFINEDEISMLLTGSSTNLNILFYFLIIVTNY
jgi:hypothetical protein